MDTIIKIEELTKKYIQGDTKVYALNDVSTNIKSNQITAVIGKSGSGKSTLLHILGALDNPTKGNVNFNGVDIFKLKDSSLTKFRSQNIGFVFQNFNLLDNFTVMENIMLNADLSNIKTDKKYIDSIIEMLDLADRVKFFPRQLSGGGRQRVAIARALATKPGIILADEPTGNLDVKSSQQFFDFIKKSNAELNQTFLIVTHNIDLANQADRTITLSDGIILSDIERTKDV